MTAHVRAPAGANPFYRYRPAFGLYRGVDIAEIPTPYLSWLRGVLDERDRGGMLRRAIDAELAKRRERDSSPW